MLKKKIIKQGCEREGWEGPLGFAWLEKASEEVTKLAKMEVAREKQAGKDLGKRDQADRL